jgi:hypothetical protein
VLPAFGVLLLVVLKMARSADGLTVNVAVIRVGLAPTEVVNEPAGIVLAACGEVTEVTTAETEQLELGAINVPTGNDNWFTPGVAVTAPAIQVVAARVVVALIIPNGYTSTKAVLKVAETSLWVLVNVITNNEVPPAVMVVGLKVLETVGRLAVMVSLSGALQVPAMQLVAVLVLVTVAGAEMDAVLVIWVCAKAVCGMASDANKPINSDNMPKALVRLNRESAQRLNNLAITGMGTPNSISMVVSKQPALKFCNIKALTFTY